MPLIKRAMFPRLSGHMTRLLDGSVAKRRVIILSQSSCSRFFMKSTSPMYSAINVISFIWLSASTVKLHHKINMILSMMYHGKKKNDSNTGVKDKCTLHMNHKLLQGEGIPLFYTLLYIVPRSLYLLWKEPNNKIGYYKYNMYYEQTINSRENQKAREVTRSNLHPTIFILCLIGRSRSHARYIS